MNHLRFLLVSALALAGSTAAAAEDNMWPIHVRQLDDAGNVISSEAAGPLIFRKPASDGVRTVSGFRPLFAQWKTPTGEASETNFLYPVFVYRANDETYRWSVLQLINRSGDQPERAAQLPEAMRYDTFDLWPFWFSRDTRDPETSYRAFFPFGGTIKNRLGYDRISFTLFPFYSRTEKKGAVATSTPWPFIKTTRGTEEGFAFWPLFGHLEKPGVFDRRFYLWPLAWNNTIAAPDDAPVGTAPRREFGILPFYTSETAPGLVNKSYLWPFFGYTDRSAPNRYHETRYFWPFLVQGRGDDRYVNRFGPFYTHSNVKGADKRWIMWPIYRRKEWSDAGLDHSQRQLFYFLYRSTEQRSATNPNLPAAEKTHVWPLYSKWDNGAGRQQFQFPSPLEVFFPDNERIRTSWSPLFSIYRFDQHAPGTERQEFFWGLITSRTAPAEREFHLGPLYSVRERDGEKRVAFGRGLFGWRRSPAKHRWQFFWFDFPSKENKLRDASR